MQLQNRLEVLSAKYKLFKVKIQNKSFLAAGELIYVASLLLPQSGTGRWEPTETGEYQSEVD